MKTILLSVLASFLTLISYGQHTHNHDHTCGVNHEAETLIKQRMMSNRSKVPASVVESIKSSRNTLKVPITVCMVGTDEGEGYTDLDLMFESICRLQEDYAKFNVDFYINYPIQYLNNTRVYNNSHDGYASAVFSSRRVDRTMTLFVGPGVENARSSYYSPWGDYMFLLEAMMGYDSPTLTHEVGHFFSLNHTFYGWEGYFDENDINELANTPVSTSEPGGTVEFVRRTGGNCHWAGDGFCDTPADYISFRASCTRDYNLVDPYGDALEIDETNIMSYFSDECIEDFTTEQQDAIIRDIYQRGWGNLGADVNNREIVNYSLNAINPSDGTNLFADVSGDIEFNWEPISDATHYLFKIRYQNKYNPNIGLDVYSQVIEGSENPSYTLPVSVIDQNPLWDNFYWTVKPLNADYFCAEEAAGASFELTRSLTSTDDLNGEAFSVFPNPFENTIQFSKFRDNLVDVEVFDLNGRLVHASKVSNGQVNLEKLVKGMYSIRITSDNDTFTSKVVKN